MPHPFKMSPSDDEIEMAKYTLNELFKSLPETTCNHRTECCKAGCPNMYYSEYLHLRIDYIEKMSNQERIDLVTECLRRHLTTQDVTKPKPCPLLDGNMCSIYESRPYRCRTYGLIPDKEYEKMVEGVADDFKVEKEKIPLCNQCPHVKVKPEWKEQFPDDKLPEGKLQDDQLLVKTSDLMLGMPVQMQAMYGYLTFHDWHLLFEIGEGWLQSLSKLKVSDDWKKLPDEKKENFIQTLKKGVEDSYGI